MISVLHRRNNHRDRGRLVPQLLGWGTNNVLVPQLLGRGFQKARNFTANSHQNAWFSIWVFKNFPGWYPGPSQWEGATPPAPNTQPGLWPDAGRKRPGVGTQTLVPPQLFGRGCAPGVLTGCSLYIEFFECCRFVVMYPTHGREGEVWFIRHNWTKPLIEISTICTMCPSVRRVDLEL